MSNIHNININNFELKLKDTDDPVAQKVKWEPAKGGGSNFKTQELEESPLLYKIVPTNSAKLFSLVFLIPGLAALFIGCPYMFYLGNVFPALFLIVWGAMFSAVGYFMIKSNITATFDKSSGRYVIGKVNQNKPQKGRMESGWLQDIHAIQLLSERIRSSSSSGGSSQYTSYELNLVFKDGERLNVMDHGKQDAVVIAAKKLGKFLNVPIWQAQY